MERFGGSVQGLVIYEYLNVSRRLTPEFEGCRVQKKSTLMLNDKESKLLKKEIIK